MNVTLTDKAIQIVSAHYLNDNQNLNFENSVTRFFNDYALRTEAHCVSATVSNVINSNDPKYFFAQIFKEYCLEVEIDLVKFKESCGFTQDQNFSKKLNSYFE